MSDFVKVTGKTQETSSVERAKLRVQQLRGNNPDYLQDELNEFDIPPHVVPDGWTYEWKTRYVMGAEDPGHMRSLQMAGWEPVPASRHPDMMPLGTSGEIIERKGMILMERPAEITREARDIELRKARLQVLHKEEQLTQAPNGQFERNNKDASMIKVKKGYEAVQIPD